MITHAGLRVLMMAEDDSRSCLGLFGLPSQPKNLKIRPCACFFIARLMVMLPDVEIPPKNQKITKNLIFKKPVFRYFLTSGLYFDVREHYHQTRNEKTRIRSYFHVIWLE